MIKYELKQLSVEIKELKKKFKASQRELSRHERLMSKKDYRTNTHKFQKWSQLLKSMHEIQDDLFSLSSKYRLKHLYYSIKRGRCINEIESKTKDNSDWIYVSALPNLLSNEKIENIRDKLPIESLVSLGWVDPDGQGRLFTRDEMQFKKSKQ